MAYYDTTFYCNAGDQSTTGYYAVAKWAASTAVAAGVLRRQLAVPTVNSERVFVCIVAGTTGSTEPSWTLTRGAKTTDNTVTWMECTGIAALNGDVTNTINWTVAKAIGAPSLGTVIQRNNGASYQICTTAGAMGASEPSFSDTAGVTTTDSSAVWTSLGVVGNFTGGQAPHARLANACATNWFAAGNTIYVGDNHAESQTTAITIGPTLTATTLSKVVCHNHSGSYPPTGVTTGATISTTTATGITLNHSTGPMYFYGLTFKAGVGQSSGGSFINLSTINAWTYFDGCSLQIANTASSQNTISVGSTNNVCTFILNNTTMSFGNTANRLDLAQIQFIWQNTGQVLVTGSAVPSTFIVSVNAGQQPVVVLEALDLSQISGFVVASFGWGGSLLIKDCKLNVSAIIGDIANLKIGQIVQAVRSDSGATGYKSVRYSYDGTETTEISITRVGGASDPTGQQQSRKIVTTANSQWLRPFKAEPYAIWNPTTAANVTVTVCGTVNAGALPNNDDIWMDVEYLGSSATPLGTIVNTTKANLLASNAAVASDSSTWNNTSAVLATLDGTPTNVTLSNGNLTATHSSATNNSGARSTDLQTVGKYYCELTLGASNGSFDCIGLLLSSGTYTDIVSNGANCVAVYRSSGAIWSNNASSGKSLGSTSPGVAVIYYVAVDLTARLAWLRKKVVAGAVGDWNGDPTANPATGVGGVTIAPTGSFAPAVGFGGTSTAVNDQWTANFGQSAYDGTVPSGFGNWTLGSVYTSFKLVATLSSPQPGQAGLIYVRPNIAKPSATFYLDPNPVLS